MKIFHYHPETGVFLGEGLADPSPLEPDVWLIPAHATNATPPVISDGEYLVWSNGGWQLQSIPEPEPELEPPEPEPPAPELPYVPYSITRRQCAKELRARGLITGPEMVAMTRTGEPPAMVEAILTALPEAEVWDARADFAADTYLRNNPLLIGMMQASGAVSEDIDNFFRQAAVR